MKKIAILNIQHHQTNRDHKTGGIVFEAIGEDLVVTDGYHTVDELYEHRITLYIALCKQNKSKVWRSVKHSDGSEYEGWFVLGINKEKGEQITYHLPMSKWQECDNWCETLSKAPDFDGHSSQDVLKRIEKLSWKV